MHLELDAKIEAVLFFKSEPMRVATLAKLLKVPEGDIKNALEELTEKLAGRGVQLLRKENEIELRTAPEMSTLIETIQKEELTKDLGKAGTETLSIVLYKGPLTRSEIDYIRGVNSTFILRNLLIRGLIEKVPNPKDQRSFLYKPTLELLSFLGLRTIEELPEFNVVKTDLENFAKENQNHDAV